MLFNYNAYISKNTPTSDMYGVLIKSESGDYKLATIGAQNISNYIIHGHSDILRYSFELAYTTIIPYMGIGHASSTFYYVILEFGRIYFLLPISYTDES